LPEKDVSEILDFLINSLIILINETGLAGWSRGYLNDILEESPSSIGHNAG